MIYPVAPLTAVQLSTADDDVMLVVVKPVGVPHVMFASVVNVLDEV